MKNSSHRDSYKSKPFNGSFFMTKNNNLKSSMLKKIVGGNKKVKLPPHFTTQDQYDQQRMSACMERVKPELIVDDAAKKSALRVCREDVETMSKTGNIQ
jgi:rRNA maturation protein Nop10